MQTVVYGDILFAVNFSIDLLILVLVGYFLHLRRRLPRLLLSALLGGVYAVFFLWLSPTPPEGMLLSLAAALFLCFVAYFLKRLLKRLTSQTTTQHIMKVP